jgi:hypothetical protein
MKTFLLFLGSVLAMPAVAIIGIFTEKYVFPKSDFALFFVVLIGSGIITYFFYDTYKNKLPEDA